jgi:hypothetical protein
MTHYNLFRMAAEVMPELIMPSTPEELEQFASIVAAGEREACAKIADEEFGSTLMIGDAQPKNSSAWRIAAAIRARGESQ